MKPELDMTKSTERQENISQEHAQHIYITSMISS